eukprot:364341-Chlamydomonas_euryale.AAC.4
MRRVKMRRGGEGSGCQDRKRTRRERGDHDSKYAGTAGASKTVNAREGGGLPRQERTKGGRGCQDREDSLPTFQGEGVSNRLDTTSCSGEA